MTSQNSKQWDKDMYAFSNHIWKLEDWFEVWLLRYLIIWKDFNTLKPELNGRVLFFSDCVRLLLEHGANPNASRHDHSTPLHLAAMAGNDR